MKSDSLLDLLERWQTELDQGRDLPAAELGRDHPKLVSELERRLEDLRRLNLLLADLDHGDQGTGDHSQSHEITLHDRRRGKATQRPHGSLTDSPEGEATGLRDHAGTRKPDPVRPLQPLRGVVAGYEILDELGHGGMGVVYKARDPALNRIVALKQLLVGGRATATEKARFRAEAEAVARLHHPHVVQVYQAGEHDGQPYFVMEFVTGGSLDKQLWEAPLALRESTRLVMLLARAVHAAHQVGVIHRDLKPQNVLLGPMLDEPNLNTPWGCPKITDFGLARLDDRTGPQSLSGNVMGTPHYMAPEQAEGRMRDIGPATDVWALGVILYEMLSGEKPFEGESVMTILDRVRMAEPKPLRAHRPEAPEELEEIIRRCLRKEPGHRFSTAAALADALKDWLESETTMPLPRLKPRRRRTVWMGVAAAAVVLLSVAGGTAGWFLSSHGGIAPAPETTPTGQGRAGVQEPFSGWIDIKMSEPDNPARHNLRLHEKGARPLRPGDELKIEVKLVNRPGYCYILWFDAGGNPIPIYPWKDFDWAKRPETEEAASYLWLPEGNNNYWIGKKSPPGLETLLLLVRDTPLPMEVDLPSLLGEPLPQAYQNMNYVAWFRNGLEVMDEENRAPEEIRKPNNPAVRLQDRIQERLGSLFPFSRAVVFGNQGVKEDR